MTQLRPSSTSSPSFSPPLTDRMQSERGTEKSDDRRSCSDQLHVGKTKRRCLKWAGQRPAVVVSGGTTRSVGCALTREGEQIQFSVITLERKQPPQLHCCMLLGFLLSLPHYFTVKYRIWIYLADTRFCFSTIHYCMTVCFFKHS